VFIHVLWWRFAMMDEHPHHVPATGNTARHRRQQHHLSIRRVMVSSVARLGVALLLLLLLLSQSCQSDAAAASAHQQSSSLSSSSSSIPRSLTADSVRQQYLTDNPHRQPQQQRQQHQQHGNSAGRIDRQGFVTTVFGRRSGRDDPRSSRRQLERHPQCRIRQVPGDGSCLFHSLSLCLRHAVNGTHWDLDQDIRELFTYSNVLRQMAVDCLAAEDGKNNNNNKLFVQGNEWLTAQELADIAAQQYGMTGPEYCAAMRDETTWGGGPEIVALSNVLRRPIHVYELCVVGGKNNNNNKQGTASAATPPTFALRRMACFGSPRFDHACALHVLSADSRFPDIAPGKQSAVGNHFLAVFPLRRTKLVRGGETITTTGVDEEWDGSASRIDEEEFDTAPPSVVERLTSSLYGWLDYLVDFLDFEDDGDQYESSEN
jgi:hypothetical protein